LSWRSDDLVINLASWRSGDLEIYLADLVIYLMSW